MEIDQCVDQWRRWAECCEGITAYGKQGYRCTSLTSMMVEGQAAYTAVFVKPATVTVSVNAGRDPDTAKDELAVLTTDAPAPLSNVDTRAIANRVEEYVEDMFGAEVGAVSDNAGHHQHGELRGAFNVLCMLREIGAHSDASMELWNAIRERARLKGKKS